ncbi:unnamed protein product [Brassica oleracea var. botrytis]
MERTHNLIVLFHYYLRPEFCIPETKNKSSRPLSSSSSLSFLPLANSSPDRADLVFEEACVRARYSPPSNSRSVSYDPSSLLPFF